ncbi:hypothetical protein C8R45DRAFT_932344 [Mycena sanguinolenta]|nr:hypothetical protein C8R45DRAFT_932344 [Mycena sanguinolenta]
MGKVDLVPDRLSRVACQNGLRRLAEFELAVTGLRGLACGLCLLVLGYSISLHSPLARPAFTVVFLPSGSTPSPSPIASTTVESATARLVQQRPNLPSKAIQYRSKDIPLLSIWNNLMWDGTN